MKYGTAEYSLNEAKKQIDKALENLATVRNEVGTIMEIKNLGNSISAELSRYFKGSNYSSFDPKNRSHVNSANIAANTAVKERLAQIEAIHAENLPAIENNVATRKKISDFMGAVGITASYSVYELPSPKHRNKQSITKSAGYVVDMDRMIRFSDGYDMAKRGLKDTEDRLTKEYKTLIAAIEKAEKEEAAKTQAKEDLMELARFQVKYETTGDWRDVLDKIIWKDKYLYLGHYLLKNRGDWSDGPDYAKTGISAFTIEDKVDQMIYDEIWGLINDWDGDGRCFRDCQSSYDYLFAIVKDRQLFQDYEIVKSKISDY